MPKLSKEPRVETESEPQPVCPKCGERLRRTHNMQTKQVDVALVSQELWFCPAGHEYWRAEDYKPEEWCGWDGRSW